VSHNLTGMPQDLLGEKFKLEGGDGCFDWSVWTKIAEVVVYHVSGKSYKQLYVLWFDYVVWLFINIHN
jgi:hypothetical protein